MLNLIHRLSINSCQPLNYWNLPMGTNQGIFNSPLNASKCIYRRDHQSFRPSWERRLWINGFLELYIIQRAVTRTRYGLALKVPPVSQGIKQIKHSITEQLQWQHSWHHLDLVTGRLASINVLPECSSSRSKITEHQAWGCRATGFSSM